LAVKHFGQLVVVPAAVGVVASVALFIREESAIPERGGN